MKGAYALTHVSLYKPNQATKDATIILSKRSDRFIYMVTLRVLSDAMVQLANWRWASN
jgi:hypothetical protein